MADEVAATPITPEEQQTLLRLRLQLLFNLFEHEQHATELLLICHPGGQPAEIQEAIVRDLGLTIPTQRRIALSGLPHRRKIAECFVTADEYRLFFDAICEHYTVAGLEELLELVKQSPLPVVVTPVAADTANTSGTIAVSSAAPLGQPLSQFTKKRAEPAPVADWLAGDAKVAAPLSAWRRGESTVPPLEPALEQEIAAALGDIDNVSNNVRTGAPGSNRWRVLQTYPQAHLIRRRRSDQPTVADTGVYYIASTTRNVAEQDTRLSSNHTSSKLAWEDAANRLVVMARWPEAAAACNANGEVCIYSAASTGVGLTGWCESEYLAWRIAKLAAMVETLDDELSAVDVDSVARAVQAVIPQAWCANGPPSGEGAGQWRIRRPIASGAYGDLTLTGWWPTPLEAWQAALNTTEYRVRKVYPEARLAYAHGQYCIVGCGLPDTRHRYDSIAAAWDAAAHFFSL